VIFQHFLLKVELAIGEVNAHIFGCDETKEVMMIDAGKYDPRFETFVKDNGLNLTTIFITHDHADHVEGLHKCAKRFGAQVIAGTDRPGGYPADRVVAHGDEVQIGRLTGKVVSTPGHTPVGLSLIFPGMIFSGDALFAGAVGGTGTPETYQTQHDAIEEHLLSLPDSYEIHSGHGPASTVRIERLHNPFFT
jgi:glyoxylase-like metal-dependent hydrolase (beta-lactamase superfamily II)